MVNFILCVLYHNKNMLKFFKGIHKLFVALATLRETKTSRQILCFGELIESLKNKLYM